MVRRFREITCLRIGWMKIGCTFVSFFDPFVLPVQASPDAASPPHLSSPIHLLYTNHKLNGFQQSGKNVTLEDVIAAKAHRYPQVFLQSRSTTRHLKALDPITHDIVGYIRWKIPSTHCTESDGSPVWPEGQVPGVSDEQKRDIDRAGNLADAKLKPLEFEGEDDLDAVIGRRRDHFLAQKPYIGPYTFSSSFMS